MQSAIGAHVCFWHFADIDADEIEREVTEGDAQFVELMRHLGERVGAEHAYCSVVLVRKAG